MKDIFTRLFLINVLVLALSLYGCKKDITPQKFNDNKVSTVNNLNAAAVAPSYVVSTLIALNSTNGTPGLPFPIDICSSAEGSLFVISAATQFIYKVSPQGSFKEFFKYDQPYGVKGGANGCIYFISDRRHFDGSADSDNVVKISANKLVTIIPVKERLSGVVDLAIGKDSSIFIPDTRNQQIVKVTQQGITSILAGKKGVKGYADGQGSAAHFTYPSRVKFGEDGNLWVLDGTLYNSNQSIRKISMSGKVTTVYKLAPQYTNPQSITSFAVTRRDANYNLTPYENIFFIIRSYTSDPKIKVSQLFHLSHDGVLSAITGKNPEIYPYKDGAVLQATFNSSTSMTVTTNGIYVVDQGNGVIRKITKQ